MFFKLEGRKLELLRKLAAEKGVSLKGAAQLVFVEGVRLLASTDAGTAKLLTVTQLKALRLEALIREHWETKLDGEIGCLAEPHVSSAVVRYHRLRLGLGKAGKVSGQTRSRALREGIDGEEFERMITHDGYTMVDYLRLKNFRCTRQRLEQVVNQMELKHTPLDRAPEWALKRRARQLGNPNLAEKEWLAERLSETVSIASLAAELGVSEYNLFFFIRRFGLTHPQFRKRGVVTVDLVCAQCGQKFKRLQRYINLATKNAKNANGRPITFYCNTSCSGTSRRKEMRKEHASFIHENWREMSDQKMAETLVLSARTVRDKRTALGLKRKTGMTSRI